MSGPPPPVADAANPDGPSGQAEAPVAASMPTPAAWPATGPASLIERASRVEHAAVLRQAQAAFPGGRQLPTLPPYEASTTGAHSAAARQAAQATRAAMADPSVPALFNATFTHDGAVTCVDILARIPHPHGARGTGWALTRVKTAARLKGRVVREVADQRRLLAEIGVFAQRATVLTLDRSYVATSQAGAAAAAAHPQTSQAPALFRAHDVSQKTAPRPARRRRSSRRTGDAPATVAPASPPTTPAPQPAPAPTLRPHLISELPSLQANRRAALGQLGVELIANVPADFPLTPTQRRAWRAVRAGHLLTEPGLTAALANLHHPIHHLDVETFAPALPRYPGSHPFTTLPFQWSNHIEHADGSVDHEGYLHEGGTDPRQAFAEALLDSLGEQGSVVVYSDAEARIIRALAKQLPALRGRLLALVARLWDLHRVIVAHVYHPEFRGSFGLKRVLGALVPDLGYGDLQIRDGRSAACAYGLLVADEGASDGAGPAERAALRAALWAYCGRDSMALVRLRGVLSRAVTQ